MKNFDGKSAERSTVELGCETISHLQIGIGNKFGKL